MLNRVVLMGRLTADPELKQTQSGVTVTSFAIAVDRSRTSRDAEKQTDFINCVAWRQTAEFICRYFGKGKMIALEGSLQVRNYTDKNNNKRQAVEVLVDQVHFAGDSNSNANSNANPAPNANSNAYNTQSNVYNTQTPDVNASAYNGGYSGYQTTFPEEFPEFSSDEDLPF